MSYHLNADPAPFFVTPGSHYQHLPYGPWWDLLEPELTLIKTEPPTHIFGNPIHQFAHQADVLRLLAMKHSGGIYLDIDVFV